jgi:Holliday junction resolvase RusA-like endonuclease
MTSVVSEIRAFRIEVPGLVNGKGRPRVNTSTGHVYTPKDTQIAEAAIQEEWIAAGRPRLTGPISARVDVHVPRPAGHYRASGELSAAGLRAPHPVRKPDVDNVLKLALDALNKKAFDDDRQIVEAHVQRHWAPAGGAVGTVISAIEMESTS